jgi:hypothetical protein
MVRPAPSAARKLLKKITFKQVLILTLGLTAFLTDNAHLTSASSFESSTVSTAASRKNRRRLPSSVETKPTIDVDCASALDKIEINTEFETIRLQGINCAEKIAVVNSKFNNKLLTFPVGKKTYSSEFAYLAHGENTFVVTAGKKTVKISVFRF